MQKKNNKKAVVALTGGIGSGKSTVLAFFKTQGAKTIDCDAIVHQLLRSHKELLKRIRWRFGAEVFATNGRLDRGALGRKVFHSVRDRRILERLIHPLVRREIKIQVARCLSGLVVVDIPLYFESRWQKRIRPVIVVNASQRARIERLQKKGLKLADILARMKAQWPLEQKVRRADFVVNNNGSQKSTKQQVHQLWTKLKPHNERGIHGIRTRKKSR